jgi:atypical dual specificity phosphatase
VNCLTIFRRFASKPARFSWLIDDKIAGCARPENEAQLRWLWSEGIRAIVCLNLERPLQDEQVRNLGFEYSFIPIRDFSVPKTEQIHDFLSFVKQMLRQNKPVVVCCGAGIGRTGTMLAIYLVSRCYPPEEALEEVKAKRGVGVESYAQREAVFRYARSMGKCNGDFQRDLKG